MKAKFTDEYTIFKKKIMVRFSLTALMAVGLVFLLYLLLWYKRGGDGIANLLEYAGMDQEKALWFYHSAFRLNKEAFFAIAIILIFLILIRFLFGWLINYFENINCGIDQLLADDNRAFHLLPEMEPMETKLNIVKQTLWKRKQESETAQQRKNELVMCLAHDIRTPLTSVIGYLNLLEEAPDMPPEQKAKYIHISLEKAYRLERMVNEFFDITRFNSGQIELKKKRIDLYYMLVQVIDEHTPSFTEHGNHVTLSASEDLTVFGDPEKLARVFNNLLKNAAAYSWPDTEIKVVAEEHDGYVKINFENEGKTIPSEQLGTLFQKFLRLDGARESATGGTGLGLAIAKEIITLHGGTLEADSEDDIITFTITLPTEC